MLEQRCLLAHFNLSENQIGSAGAESLVGVLAQCVGLAHVDLTYNEIGPDGTDYQVC